MGGAAAALGGRGLDRFTTRGGTLRPLAARRAAAPRGSRCWRQPPDRAQAPTAPSYTHAPGDITFDEFQQFAMDGLLLDGTLADYERAFNAVDDSGNGSIGALCLCVG